jgi:hypothetical protein
VWQEEIFSTLLYLRRTGVGGANSKDNKNGVFFATSWSLFLTFYHQFKELGSANDF